MSQSVFCFRKVSIKRVLTEIEREDLEVPSTDDLSVPEKPRRKTSKVSKEENPEESKTDSVELNDNAGDVTEDPSTKVSEVDKNDAEESESSKDVAEQDVQGMKYIPLKYCCCQIYTELVTPNLYYDVLNIAKSVPKSKVVLSCVNVSGLHLSFESTVNCSLVVHTCCKPVSLWVNSNNNGQICQQHQGKNKCSHP